jgi:ABC-type glycerol-3-phosphate transport system substrate-binding protein
MWGNVLMPADIPASRPLSRRNALKALTLPGLAGLGATGCGASGQTVQVAVIWTGWELRQFERVMDAFSDRYHIGYQLLSMGDDTGAFLGNEVTAAAQPDVALVSAPGLVRGNSTRLAEVGWPVGDAPSWRNWLAQGGVQYGVWFKAAYQSMVWHTDDLNAPDSGWDWDTWVEHCRTLAAGGQAPLSVGAADGWVLAAWFANVLLSIDPGTYQALASEYATSRYSGNGPTWDHPSVREALRRLALVWQIEGVFPGGAERALATQFDQSVLDVFASRRAAMVVGADYFWPIIIQSAQFPSGKVGWFPFPSKPGEHIPAVVGGDAAVLFRRPGGDGPGKMLIDWLGTADAARIWAGAGGYLSINEQVTKSYYPYPATMNTEKLISYVQHRSTGGGPAAFNFDMADLLGGPLGGGDGEGTWKIFTDFFTEVAVRRSPVPEAIDAAVAALDDGSSGA